MFPLIVPTLLLIASIGIVYYKTPNRSSAWLASIAFLALMLINGVFYGADYFTGNGIDESVIFHLRVGLGGSGFSEYLGLIAAGILYAVLTLAGTFFLYRSIKSGKRSTSLPSLVATILLVTVAFVVHPATRDLYVLSSAALADSGSDITQTDFPEEYISVTPTIPDRKNVIYLYLEGVERTYLDEDLFPGLMPNIRELEKSATTFTDIRQITHTGWTIAGMVASQCGIPLFSPSDGNSLAGLDQFLPQATCLGDILKENGYFLSYMGGADITFAGKGSFYQSHGFDSVQGRDELAEDLGDSGYLSGWGLYDDTLLSLVKEEYLDLSRQGAPFGLFALTLDTHHPDGHISKACEGLQYRDGDNPILNAVHCSDRLVREFVDFIRDNPSSNGTTIVISSDHYALNNTASDILARGRRRNLALVIDDQAQHVPGEIGKRGSMLDIAPTVLSFLGTDIEGLAFGRNLLSDSPTLHEEKTSINGFLNANRNTVRYLWDYPQLDDGIQHYREEGDQLAFGDRRITMPAILMLDDDGRVHEIIFSHSGQREIGDYIADLSPGQSFLWADRCGIVGAFTGSDDTSAEWCMASGTAGAATIHLWEADNTYIARDEVLDTLSAEEDLSAAHHRQRLDRIAKYFEYGALPLATVSLSSDEEPAESVFVRSSAYGAGESFLERGGIKVPLTRGLTLLGLSNEGPPHKLSHVDSCEGVVTDAEAPDSSGDFRSVLENHSETFAGFLIAGHDSVVCSDPDVLGTYMAGLDLHAWREIGFRQPYIAFLPADGETEEWVGGSEETIAIEVK